MSKYFISDKGFAHEISRERALGYKRVVIDDDVGVAAPFQFVTRDRDLAIELAEEDGEQAVYTMLCKEFGLVGGNKGFTNKISVIFCDNGWMLVTLYNGALVMNLDDRLLMPAVGVDKTPKVVQNDILWVDAEKLLAYGKYLDNVGLFMYDHEFFLELSGDNNNGMGSFKFRNLADETIDISLGYIAVYEQQQQKKAEAREAQRQYKGLAAMYGWGKPSQAEDDKPVFEEYEPEEGEDEEDDDSGVDW